MKRMACAIALAAGSGLAGIVAVPAIAEPNPVFAASGLQVNIVPPGTVSGDTTIPLDVKFHGGNIRVIELFVDGARLTRQMLTTRDGRGVVHFSLDPSLLTEGSHEILIKAFEADGTCATTTSQISIASSDFNALARFEWPRRNSEVQGNVPIKIKIDPSIMDPYVTYTVDNDFLAFRNYAPYIYNWDTSKLDNGKHKIGIDVMDGRTLQVVQKLTIEVNVKNVGGFTNVQPAVKPAPKVEKSNIAATIMSAAESGLPDASTTVRDSVLDIARNSAHLLQPLNGPRASAPSRDSRRATYVVPNVVAIAAPKDSRPVSKGNTTHVAPGLEALTANPADLMPAIAPSAFGISRQSAHFRSGGAIALRPSAEHRVRGASPSAPTLPSFKLASRKTFDIAFNNTLINFDVPPRVENGLPLAPFRAIFEHSGGKVQWNNGAKVLRAFDSEHEIVITIGSKEATVNNVPMSMAVTPYIDHGRTIVPLSFVSAAMDVKISFDEATGHLMIEKK